MVDDVGVAFAGGKHERGLVVFVQADARGFMAEREKERDDGEVAEVAGEVEGGVGEAGEGVIGVVEERGVGFENAGAEEGVGDVDGAPEAEGWVYPVLKVDIG